ncbi:PREDICTED: allatostatin-A receptor [Polistes dominula]|uniref:Allatostatin-A receptor n=1 Tax=Polistes dominula TaxID=743375 RepID=A0ABM1J8U5_POLDO|nr:PREDICTED: allatostatin-A receptor [Polistes dominula]
MMAITEEMLLIGENTSIRINSDPEINVYELDNNINGTFIYNQSNYHLFYNDSMSEDYIFDRTDVKVIFILLYTVVFVCCLFGNLMVILVVTFSRRLPNITNFFLANLAVADFCVGIFCVYQTLINYLMNSWRLGNFLCKVYMFVHALSYTASILILMVVCIERYLATVHPIKCKSMLTRSRLRAVIGIIWIIAAFYASPRFIYFETISNELSDGDVDIICGPNMKKYKKHVIDAVNFIFLYLLPLALMSYLYTKIAVRLWRSGVALGGPGLVAKTKNGRVQHIHTSCRKVLRTRRGVIRMLIAVVVLFALCNLPQQVRIIWLHWGPNYDRTSNFTTLLTVSTFLISYTNCCLNPFLYAFLSRNFRQGMREIPCCKGKGDRAAGGLALTGCASGETTRQENGTSGNLIPHTILVRLSSVQESPCTTHTIPRRNTYEKST